MKLMDAMLASESQEAIDQAKKATVTLPALKVAMLVSGVMALCHLNPDNPVSTEFGELCNEVLAELEKQAPVE